MAAKKSKGRAYRDRAVRAKWYEENENAPSGGIMGARSAPSNYKESKQMKSSRRIRALVECALMVALAFVLDLIPLPKWPNGGSVSISAVPIVFLSYRLGWGWGLGAGVVYSALQMILGFYPPPSGSFLG